MTSTHISASVTLNFPLIISKLKKSKNHFGSNLNHFEEISYCINQINQNLPTEYWFKSVWQRLEGWDYYLDSSLARWFTDRFACWPLNWCPVIVSIRQQVSPILSLVVISLLIDQWDDLLRFKFSVGCKLLDNYDILLILITKAKWVLRKKQIHTEILDSCLKFGRFCCI